MAHPSSPNPLGSRTWAFSWKAAAAGGMAWFVGKVLDAMFPRFVSGLSKLTPILSPTSLPFWFIGLGIMAGLIWAAWPDISRKMQRDRAIIRPSDSIKTDALKLSAKLFSFFRTRDLTHPLRPFRILAIRNDPHYRDVGLTLLGIQNNSPEVHSYDQETLDLYSSRFEDQARAAHRSLMRERIATTPSLDALIHNGPNNVSDVRQIAEYLRVLAEQ